jgi:3-dehydroquinate synthetase
VAAARLSRDGLGLPEEQVQRISNLFQRAGLPTEARLTAPQRKKLFAAMKLDKKVSGGEIKFALARAIGKVEIGQSVSPTLIEAALKPPSSTLKH